MTSNGSTNGSLWSAVMKWGGFAVLVPIVMYLVYQMGERLPPIENGVGKVLSATEQIKEQHMDLKVRFDNSIDNEQERGEMMIKLLRANCLNQAETKDERLLCNP